MEYIFDTHAHYDDEDFDEDRDALLMSMKEHGVGTIVNIAANTRSCRTTLELTEKYPFVYGALGIHPSDSGDLVTLIGREFVFFKLSGNNSGFLGVAGTKDGIRFLVYNCKHD